jgi:hypothetical protein
MSYLTEFPDFDAATMPAIPEGWTDTSWHNDTCPSFNTGKGHIVFIDFADIALREIQEEYPRFTVRADPDHANSDDELLSTDDWAAVLALVDAT